MLRILIIHFGALGDLLLSRPTLLSIRRHFGKAQIDFGGYPHLLSLIIEEMKIKQVYDINDLLFDFYRRDKKGIWRSYDLIIIFARRFPKEWQETLEGIKTFFIQTIPPANMRLPVFQYQLGQWQKNFLPSGIM